MFKKLLCYLLIRNVLRKILWSPEPSYFLSSRLLSWACLYFCGRKNVKTTKTKRFHHLKAPLTACLTCMRVDLLVDFNNSNFSNSFCFKFKSEAIWQKKSLSADSLKISRFFYIFSLYKNSKSANFLQISPLLALSQKSRICSLRNWIK